MYSVCMLLCAVWVCVAQDDEQALLQLLRAQRYGNTAVYKQAHQRLSELAQDPAYTGPQPAGAFRYYGISVIKTVPVLYWQILFLVGWYLLCWCLFRKKRCAPTKVYTLSLLLLILLVPIMLGYYTDTKEVLVVAQSGDLYNGPNSGLYTVGTLQRNTVARVLAEKKDWYKIAHGATIGWVESDKVVRI